MSDFPAPDTKLRIWHIAETYPPEYGGGAAIYIQDICRALAQRGHEVRVLCVESDAGDPYAISTDYDGQVRVDRINLPYFKTQDPDGSKLGIMRWRKHQQRVVQVINKLLSEWRPDIVNYNTSRPLGEECLVAINRHGIPIVALLHEAWLACARSMLLRSPISEPCEGPAPLRCLECVYSYYDRTHARAMMKLPWRLVKLGAYPAYRLLRRAAARRQLSGAIAYSQFITRVHKNQIPGQVEYIPLGINLSGLTTDERKLPRKPLRFGFVAGFQPHKGIYDVLDAAASLSRDGFEFELHIWGPDEAEGSAAIKARNLDDKVRIRGIYQPEQIWEVYSEIDIAIMATTVCESFGRVPLEAAAVGIPTIAPAVGGITESIRDGIDGLLYRFRDPNDLTRQMRRVLEVPGFVEQLMQNIHPVSDTRDRACAVEEYYFSVLDITPQPALAT
jgi:glycosyltransferase involved in cell wall biosynthesis